jgi:hypothetical protein
MSSIMRVEFFCPAPTPGLFFIQLGPRDFLSESASRGVCSSSSSDDDDDDDDGV